MRKAEHEVRAQAEKVILHSASTPSTDLMNSFELAAKIFNGGDWPPATRKVLVVFSDMVEQSHHYDFTAIDLTEARIAQIIADERAGGRLPDLHGVKVWVAGAALAPSAGARLTQNLSDPAFLAALFPRLRRRDRREPAMPRGLINFRAALRVAGASCRHNKNQFI